MDNMHKSSIAIQTETEDSLGNRQRQNRISTVNILPTKRSKCPDTQTIEQKPPKAIKLESTSMVTKCCTESVLPGVKNYRESNKSQTGFIQNGHSHQVISSSGGTALTSTVSTTSREGSREQNPCNLRHATPTTMPHHIDPLFCDL